jgi:hypothetical protein
MWRFGRNTAGMAIAIASLALTACSSTPAPPPTQGLQFESIPSGANVQLSQGPSCRAPCSMTTTVVAQTATFSMAGYQDQQIPLTVRQPEPSLFNTKLPFLLPNPVTAALQPLPPPPPKGKFKRTKMSAAPKAEPAPAPPPPQATRPPPQPEPAYHPPPPRPWNAPGDSSPFPRQ